MVALIGLFVITVMLRYPQIPMARALRRHGIEPLARWLNQLDRRQLIFFFLLASTVLLGCELLAALGPLDMGLVLLWDVSLYVDALLSAVAVASVARLLPTLRFWRARPRPRARRRCSAARKVARNDDEDGRSLIAA